MVETREPRGENWPRWRVAVTKRRSDDVLATILVANVRGGALDAVQAAKQDLRKLGIDGFQELAFSAERW